MIRLRIIEVMNELGWNQNQLAERAGLSRQAISNLVHDPVQIRFDTLEKICRATGKQLAEIIVISDDTMTQ